MRKEEKVRVGEIVRSIREELDDQWFTTVKLAALCQEFGMEHITHHLQKVTAEEAKKIKELVFANYEKKEYLNKDSLKERGWTDSLIRRFLSEPDQTKPNPVYKKAAPMKLYDKKRVEDAEATKDFQGALAKSKRLSQSAKARAEAKREKLLEELDKIGIEVPNLPIETLRGRAIRHYNKRKLEWAERRDISPYEVDQANEDSDKAFLNRIMVNYLRHHGKTGYERIIDSLFGKVGKYEGYSLIKDKILHIIASRYPSLADECRRQAGEDEEESPV